MHNWVIWSVPFYFALTSSLKGRANAVALWVYFWCLAGYGVLATWHCYIAWQHLASWLPQDKGPPQLFWISLIATVVLLILPVVWYRRDLRKERSHADASQTA
jgi:ABC-type glycerol-3-phosphate transport system permease component